MTKYIQIGYTQKTHGLKGELKLTIEEPYLEDFLKNERLFVEVKGTKIPYFIENVRGAGAFILKLEDVDDKDAAYGLQSRPVFLREQDLIPETQRELTIDTETLEYQYLTGYVIEDANGGIVGEIEEVLDMPQQEMAFLKYKGKDVLIPLNTHFIVRVDESAKRVVMNLPEGLLAV